MEIDKNAVKDNKILVELNEGCVIPGISNENSVKPGKKP